MTLGEKLSEHRKAKNLTQDSVAETLGVTPQAVSKWECDISCPDIALLPAIADLYGTTIDALLSHEPAPIASVVPVEKRKSLNDMVLRVRVEDSNDKIRVNLPLALIKIFLDAGISPSTAGSQFNINGLDLGKLDWQAIITLVENGVVGRLVEIEDNDGDTVVVEVV